jgi:alanyl-tRNA synthetase
MPTDRLYYTDSLLTDFDASVVAAETTGGRLHIVLDRSAFYPTSGGQPHDLGTLGDATVVDVIDREDGEIAHVVDRPIAVGAKVQGHVDWTRRLDHMQQHTGQHILSAAFDRLFNVRTTSFHLGAETATIDLAREVTPAEIARAERLANEAVWADRAVTIRFVSEEDAKAMPLRKESMRTGTLRLIEVPDIDLSACGGTHVPRTGMIGIIAVAGWERFKGASRITFLCGGRTLAAFGRLRDVVDQSTRLISVAPAEIPAAIERLQADLKASARTERRMAEELAVYRAAEFRAGAETVRGGRGVLRAVPGADPGALKALASAIVGEPGFVVVLVGTPGGDGASGPNVTAAPVAPIVVARSADIVFDAGAWLKQAAARFGGRGGGRPELAQGGLTAAADVVLSFARESMNQ